MLVPRIGRRDPMLALLLLGKRHAHILRPRPGRDADVFFVYFSSDAGARWDAIQIWLHRWKLPFLWHIPYLFCMVRSGVLSTRVRRTLVALLIVFASVGKNEGVTGVWACG